MGNEDGPTAVTVLRTPCPLRRGPEGGVGWLTDHRGRTQSQRPAHQNRRNAVGGLPKRPNPPPPRDRLHCRHAAGPIFTACHVTHSRLWPMVDRQSLTTSRRPLLASFRVSRKIGKCRLGKSFPFFQSASSASKIHQRNLKERWPSCGKMGEMGLEKMGKLSKIVSFFSDFPPNFLSISHMFYMFPKMYFRQFLTIPHFPPFPPIPPHFPSFSPIPPPCFFHFSDFSKPLRLGG